MAPPQLADATVFAAHLSAGLDYLRVDFVAGGSELYLSEITLYPGSGFGKDNWWGEVIYRLWIAAIQKSWPLGTPQP